MPNKPSFSYSTGDKVNPRTVTTPLAFTRYARLRLGCDTPVGGKERGLWYQQLAEEMQAQGWTWPDLIRAVEYCNKEGIVVRKIYGVFYYVEKARRAADRHKPIDDLPAKVAEALAKETDEDWVRRLSLAKGKALERVYREWSEREV